MSKSVIIIGADVEFISGGEQFEAKFDFFINAPRHRTFNITKSYRHGAPAPRQNFAKSNYFSIASKAPFQTLVYPESGTFSFGIRYAINLNGRGQLGPNVQWVNRPKIEGSDFVLHQQSNIITLPGTVSPGLTSSLAITEVVKKSLNTHQQKLT